MSERLVQDSYISALCSSRLEIYDYLRANVHDPHLAEDLVQDTLVKALEKSEIYDEAKGNILGWLKTIAHNTYLDHFRRQARRPTAELDEARVPYGSLDGVDQILDARMILGNLSENERKVLGPFVYGYSTLEIAEEMGLPIGTVKSRLFRTKMKVREAAL